MQPFSSGTVKSCPCDSAVRHQCCWVAGLNPAHVLVAPFFLRWPHFGSQCSDTSLGYTTLYVQCWFTCGSRGGSFRYYFASCLTKRRATVYYYRLNNDLFSLVCRCVLGTRRCVYRPDRRYPSGLFLHLNLNFLPLVAKSCYWYWHVPAACLLCDRSWYLHLNMGLQLGTIRWFFSFLNLV